jgi:hypothetical protein
MWTPGAGSSGEAAGPPGLALAVASASRRLALQDGRWRLGRQTLTMGRRGQDSELSESLSLVRSQVSLLKRLIRV